MPPHRASAAPVDDEPSKFVSESADRRRQFAEDGTETPRTAVNASKTFNAPEVPHHLSHREKEANAAGWRSEVQEIPKQRSFVIVYLALCLCVFLGALDQTIVAVALPSIVREIGGEHLYSWIGSAYLLMAACLAPAWGKAADVAGRKPILLTAISLFLVGSALCGASQTAIMLVMCRGVQGLGGGGLIQMVQITISDITALQDRGKFTGGVGAVWGIASVLGPLVGGAIVQNTTWRWLFFINLPTGGLAAAVLLLCLRVPRKKGKTFKEHAREFDYVGLPLIVGGVASLLVGFNNGETSWASKDTIIPLAIGAAALVAGAINEVFTKQSPVIPPRLFHTRTTAAILILNFCHGLSFFAGAYYLPVYFQVLGSNPLVAGVRTLPFSLGGSLTSLVGGVVLGKFYRNYKRILMFSFFWMTLGFGLMIMLDGRNNIPMQVFFPLIAALGLGPGFPVPLIALQSAMPPSSIATAVGAFGLVRTLSGACGIAIGNTIFASELRNRLPNVAGFDDGGITGSSHAALSFPISALRDIRPLEVRAEVIKQYALSLRVIWMVVTPLAGIAWICTFFFKVYSLNRPGQNNGPVAEKEKAQEEDGNSDRTQVDSDNEARKPEDEESGIAPGARGMGDNAPSSGVNGRPVNRKEAVGEALEESAPL